MPPLLDSTHAPALRSWVASANDESTDFPVQNLPLGVFRTESLPAWRVGVAIGDHVLDLVELSARGMLAAADPAVREHLAAASLNGLLELGRPAARSLRASVSECLRSDTALGRRTSEMAATVLHPLDRVQLRLPVDVGDYSDFYASVDHATNVGRMLRPDQPLMPNYKWVPIGYHGRASSLVVSGTPICRPRGQIRPDATAAPRVGLTERLDYEAELGFVIGSANALGSPVTMHDAGSRIGGVLLLNDWSARDIQAWEYQPLGPFLSKDFATSLSPWLVMIDALAPFRSPARVREPGDPGPLAYLNDDVDQATGAFDIQIEVWLTTPTMRARGMSAHRLSRSTAANLYWTPAQLVTHHASNGCPLRVGDVLGSGTVSGPTADSRSCLLELTWRGTEPILLPSGEQRRFLEDGDEVELRGRCQRDGFRSIGFGSCTGRIVAAYGEQ